MSTLLRLSVEFMYICGHSLTLALTGEAIRPRGRHRTTNRGKREAQLRKPRTITLTTIISENTQIVLPCISPLGEPVTTNGHVGKMKDQSGITGVLGYAWSCFSSTSILILSRRPW